MMVYVALFYAFMACCSFPLILRCIVENEGIASQEQFPKAVVASAMWIISIPILLIKRSENDGE